MGRSDWLNEEGFGESDLGKLENNTFFRTNEFDEFLEIFQRFNALDKIDLCSEASNVEIDVGMVRCGELNLFHVGYGATQIELEGGQGDPDQLKLCIPSGGRGMMVHGKQEILVDRQNGLIRDLTKGLQSSQENFSGFIIDLSKNDLIHHAQIIYGDAFENGDIHFDATFDLTSEAGQQLRRTVEYVAQSLDNPALTLNQNILTKSFQDLLLTHMLLCVDNNYLRKLGDGPRYDIVPRHVKRAREYIHENLGRNISMEDLARAGGCSYRSIQLGFKDFFDMSPMAYLKNRRLNAAYEKLTSYDYIGSIEEVARDLGFEHMGRFSQEFKKKFGDPPSKLRKRFR